MPSNEERAEEKWIAPWEKLGIPTDLQLLQKTLTE